VTLTTTAPRATAYTQPVPYLPGLDGLRALAVIAVIVYHGHLTWLRGGFLGVEVFFVISGYLITMLLLSEHRRRGSIGLRGFWFRRARRLLPAVFALLIVVTAVSVVFVRDELSRLRGDLIAALTYTMNWHLILGGTSYFDQFGRPPLLRHLWSLAVEEQFYLLWPPILLLLLVMFRKRPDRLLLVLVGAALASALLMAVLYVPADPSRAYYGTDTRMAGLLLGSCLAVFWHPRQLARRIPPVRPRLVRMAGWTGLAGLVALCVLATERGAFLYRGGFLLVDLATVLVIAAITHPLAHFGRALRMPLLVYIGLRSYSIYLWHWPVFALTRPGEDISAGPVPVFILRVALTLILADLSYRLVEAPIRGGAIGRWAREWGHSRGPERARLTRNALLIGTAGGVAAYLLTAAVVTAKPAVGEIEQSIREGEAALANQTTLPLVSVTRPLDGGDGGPDASGVPPTTTATTVSGAPAASVGTLPPVVTTTTTIPPVPPIQTIAIGDSVMLGAAPKLLAELGPNVLVDALVGRQYKDALPILQQLKAARRLGPNLVLHLGNNGSVSAQTFHAVMDVIKDVPNILVVNVRVTKPWELPVNDMLTAEVKKYRNARLLDWWLASACCGDWFYSDKTHLRAGGAEHYADIVKATLGKGPPAAPATTAPPPTTVAATTTAAPPTTRPPATTVPAAAPPPAP
jgi:peptidoglycan/LPS O-acetylase OafA/YrhL